MTAVDLPTAVIRLRDDRIIEVRVRDRARVTHADAVEQLALMWRLCAAGGSGALLIDLGRATGVDAGARHLFATDRGPDGCFRVAVVVTSPVARVIGTIILRSNRQVVPTRLFTDEAAAVAWLLGTGPP